MVNIKEFSYNAAIGIDPDTAETYSRRIHILLMRGEFLAAWMTIAEAYELKHKLVHRKPIAERPLSDGNLPTRLINALEGEGILTWGQLSQQTQGSILKIPNVSEKSLIIIQAELRKQIDLG